MAAAAHSLSSRSRLRAYTRDDGAVGPGQLTGLFAPGPSRVPGGLRGAGPGEAKPLPPPAPAGAAQDPRGRPTSPPAPGRPDPGLRGRAPGRRRPRAAPAGWLPGCVPTEALPPCRALPRALPVTRAAPGLLPSLSSLPGSRPHGALEAPATQTGLIPPLQGSTSLRLPTPSTVPTSQQRSSSGPGPALAAWVLLPLRFPRPPQRTPGSGSPS
ncbi:basic proline-rich protein-like [Manis pentadactyla]|uniref:basic proline-rich protein-like n=1 Tax=Manis pentadactyla TaxID=143292 RepID=UPI00255C843D|nr:basic proline-rich protein-like [Manis pentadactyla]